MMLSLPGEVTFQQLRDLIAEQVSLSPDRQRLRIGFPPKELKQPENADEIIPLLHGDKINVEILPDKSVPMETDVRKGSSGHCRDIKKVGEVPSGSRSLRSWSSFDEEAQGSTEEALLRALKATEGGRFCFIASSNQFRNTLNWVGAMEFNATFNNISVISWRSVLLMEETRENHRPVASH